MSPPGAPERQLYLYWKTDTLAEALRQARALQAGWRTRFPGLQAELLLRPSTGEGLRTLMEIYRRPPGVDEALQAVIEREGAQALREVLRSPRVVELFELDNGAGN